MSDFRTKEYQAPPHLMEELENIAKGRSSPKGYHLRRVAGQAEELIMYLRNLVGRLRDELGTVEWDCDPPQRVKDMLEEAEEMR